MTYKYINLSYDQNVAILKFNAPEVLNATSRAMMEEFSAAISAVSENASYLLPGFDICFIYLLHRHLKMRATAELPHILTC